MYLLLEILIFQPAMLVFLGGYFKKGGGGLCLFNQASFVIQCAFWWRKTVQQKFQKKKTCHLMTFNNDIVDGRNPAPPEM